MPDLALPPDTKPWYEHSAFRGLVATLYGIWTPFLYEWVRRLAGEGCALATIASLTAILSTYGFVKVAAQSEARGRAQQRRGV